MKACKNELIILYLHINQNKGKVIPVLPEIGKIQV
jgi:hypothetical protein